MQNWVDVRGYINRFVIYPIILNKHFAVNFSDIIDENVRKQIINDIEILKQINPISMYRVYESCSVISLIIYFMYGKHIFDNVVKLIGIDIKDDFLNKKEYQIAIIKDILYGDENELKYIKFQKAISYLVNVNCEFSDSYFLDT